MVEELRDTWTKKQIFRTETEMKVAVLDDGRYPTRASKYWQCVREQNVFLENLMSLSFDYRRNEAKIKQLQKKLETETDEYKRELYQIDLDEKIYGKANMELVARDRLREIKLWSKFKAEYDDGSFDTKNVNSHQFESLAQIMEHKKNSITPGSSQAEVFNVLSQVDTIDRIKKEKQLGTDKKEQLPFGKPILIKRYSFLLALPRSGNTLFGSIMNQNPDIAVTANSITLEIMKDIYLLKETDVFQNYPDHKSLDNVLSSVYNTYYKDWNYKYIIDRGPVMTPGNLMLMKQHLGQPIKCIVIWRDLLDVLSILC
jgi:hypothetical protein